MNEQAIQEQYQHIVSLLEQKRLKEAQIQLEAFLWKCKDWTLHSRFGTGQSVLPIYVAVHAPGHKRSGTTEVVPTASG